MIIKQLPILLILLSIINNILAQNSQICDFVNSTTSLKNYSCIDEKKRELYETCFSANFCTEENNYQSKTLPQCPFGFMDSQDICYKISDKSPFPPSCPFENVLPFESYKNILQEQTLPVWMPVQRNLTNGLGFLQWTEHSNRYKTVFEDSFYYENGIEGKDCLLYYNNSYTVAISCKEQHNGVCAYRKPTQRSNPLCGDSNTCVQKSLNPRSNCVCLEFTRDRSSYSKAQFLDPYENNVFGMLTNKTCTIGLERVDDGSFIWSTTKKTMEYSYWAPEVIFNDSFPYVAATSMGWVLTKQSPSCTLVEKHVKMILPRLKLTISNNMNYEIILNISSIAGLLKYDETPLVYCYTDADPLSLLYRYSYISLIEATDSYMVYKFQPVHNYSGHYWCEGFTYFDSGSITSNVVFLEGNEYSSHELSAFVRLTYDSKMNPLSPDIVGLLSKSLANSSCPYRMVKLDHLDEERKQISATVRFSCSKETWAGEYNRGQRMKTISNEILNSVDKNVSTGITFFSANDFCSEDIENNLTWPQTSAGTWTYSEEYCFKADGQRLQRQCIDNGELGAQWDAVNETCQIPSDTSSKTSRLERLCNREIELDVTTSSTPTPLTSDPFETTPLIRTSVSALVISEVREISQDYSEFVPFDVYLTACVLTHVKNTDSGTYAEQFMDIINNILNIDSKILLESQKEMRATEKFLNLMNDDDFDNSLMLNEERSNLAVIDGMYYNGSSYGFVIQDQDQPQISSIDSSSTLDDILKIEDLRSAVFINSSYIVHISQFTIYFKDGFFLEDSFLDSKNTTVSDIFELKLYPYEDPVLNPLWLIHRPNDNTYTKDVECVYWDTENSKWTSNGEFQVIDSYFICKFFGFGTFALLFTPRINHVYQQLSDILASGDDSYEMLYNLQVITNTSDEFSPTDVYLIGEIFKKISDSNDTDLDMLSRIISNLQNIERSELVDSQSEFSATDIILYYIDRILLNYPYTSDPIVAENYITSIYNLTNFGSFLLFDNNTITVLKDSVNITKINTYENISSAVVLSSELKKQFSENDTISVSVFFTDALFNEKNKTSNHTVFGKIYSILLPEIATNFSEPVFIFHKIKTTLRPDCSHWSYNISEDVASFWKNDSSGNMNDSSFVQCDFWHTTHFGVLLFDDNKYEEELSVLDIITNVTCSLSLLGYCVIILTAFLFESWRKEVANKILLSFVVSGLFQEVVFFISSNVRQYSENQGLCVFTGIILHYSVLVQFSWMLIIALFQYRTLVLNLKQSENITRVVLKSNLVAWGFSLIPVIIVVAVNNESYADGNVGICYPSGYALYLGVWWPVSVVIVINFIICLFIIDVIVNKKNKNPHSNQQQHGDFAETYYHIKRITLIFFIFGLTWIFGFLSEIAYSILFVYLFDILSTIQGLILFLMYIVFDKEVKTLYSKKFGSRK